MNFPCLLAESDWVDIAALGVNFLALISTTIIAIIAVWPQIDLFRYPPTLIASLRSDRTLKEAFDGGTRCVHIVVSNPNREYHSVKSVVLYLCRMVVISQDGSKKEFRTGRVPLKWQFNDCVYAGSDQLLPRPADVGPERIGDLLFLCRKSFDGGSKVGPPVMTIRSHFLVSDFEHEFKGLTHFQAELKAEGDNAESNPLLIDIKWDGTWQDDDTEMAKHLQISVLPASNSIS